MDAHNLKSIYFACRNPELREPFRPRWRRHAALAMGLPVWSKLRRYAQYDPVTAPAELRVTTTYDGIGMSWFMSPNSFAGFREADYMQLMRRDELEIFGVHVATLAVLASEFLLKDDLSGLFKIFSTVSSLSTRRDQPFITALQCFALPFCTDSRLCRLALNVALTSTENSRGRPDDAVIEYSFHTLGDAVAFFGTSLYAHQRQVAANSFLIDRERCATREVLMHDCDLYPEPESKTLSI